MPPELDCAAMASDIVQKGYLRKAKSWNKRYFVLKDSNPARLEYYENEKKWKNSSGKPRRRLTLEKPWNIDKKRDSKHEYLIVIFTEDEYISLAAESADDQKLWIDALLKVVKPEQGFILFKHMWHVMVENKNLEGNKPNPLMNLQGLQRVCLTHDQIVFVHANSGGGSDFSKGDPLEISMTGVRSFGHTKEGSVFISPGRACGITDGKLWMDLNDEIMAYDMHQAIKNASNAPKQDEFLDYRSRSYSSGSNAGRTRSIRYNNPPPSQIGMGKIANASSSRIRCASMPVSNITGSNNDPRYRTGSEGEHTMKKPPLDGLKNACPAVEGKYRTTVVKRYRTAYPYPYTSHSHTTSLPGCCSGSSTASSIEHLNAIYNTTDAYPNTPCNNATVLAAEQDYVGNVSYPGGTYSHLSKSAIHNGCAESSVLSNQEMTDSGRGFCSNCLNPLPINIRFSYVESAPPPPDSDPPHISQNLSNISYPDREYVNYSYHSRGQSIDDNLSLDTPISSLSASPQQGASMSCSSHIPIRKNFKYSTVTAASLSPNIQPATLSTCSSVASSVDEYTSMSSSGKYPHQKSVSISQKSPTVPAKFLPDVSISSEPRKQETVSGLEYTQMILPFSVAEDQTNFNSESTTSEEYVHMRSILPKPSTPQDINYRRRSIPETSRMSVSSSYRSSPSNGFSPPDDSFEQLCPSCRNQLLERRLSNVVDIFDDCRQMEHFTSRSGGLDNFSNETSKGMSSFVREAAAKAIKAPPIVQLTAADEKQATVKSTPIKHVNISVQSLQQEIMKLNDNSNETDISQSSPSIAQSARHEQNGYLTMTGLHGGDTLQYPYQKRSALSLSPKSQSAALETNSLDRCKMSSSRNGKAKRSSRQFGMSSSKRSHSLRHCYKPKLNHPINTESSVPSTSPASPGGEYVNIDREKALQQLDSPHIALSDDEASMTRTNISRCKIEFF